MKKFGHMKNKVLKVLAIISSHHTGAYAAQAAYFFMLSLIPIIILLITMVQFTTVSQEEVLETVMQIFPTSVEGMVRSIVMEVYRQSGATISLSVIMVVWSAGKGVLSITSGLNCIYDNTETRNYVFLRLRASLYTVLFIVAIVLSLVLSGFGNSIALLVQKHVPVVAPFIDFIIQIRTHLNLVVLNICLTARTTRRRRCGSNCRGRCLALVCGSCYPWCFPFTWIFSRDLVACTAA